MTDLAWALARVRKMRELALTNAERLGPKLLKGHGYPDEIFSDAQDYLALTHVLDAIDVIGVDVIKTALRAQARIERHP